MKYKKKLARLKARQDWWDRQGKVKITKQQIRNPVQ